MRPSELSRVIGLVDASADVLAKKGVLAWKLTKDWSGVTSSAPADGEFVRKSTLSDPTAMAALNRDDDARMHERFVKSCVVAWEAADQLTSKTLDYELRRTIDLVNRGADIHPVFLVGQTAAALERVAHYLAEHGTELLMKKTGDHQEFVDRVNQLFRGATDVRSTVIEVTRWVGQDGRPTVKKIKRERTIPICVEGNCRDDILGAPRKGRCQACYAWGRRWSQQHGGQPAPPVPQHVIDARSERRERTGS